MCAYKPAIILNLPRLLPYPEPDLGVFGTGSAADPDGFPTWVAGERAGLRWQQVHLDNATIDYHSRHQEP
jgi:hypothetical protein